MGNSKIFVLFNIKTKFSITSVLILSVVTMGYCEDRKSWKWNYPKGEPCKDNSQCEHPSSSLFCINGTCQCFDETRMNFYYADDSFTMHGCTVNAGESCIVNSTNSIKTNLKELKCTPYAVCKNGTCQCENTYKDGIWCTPHQPEGYGSTCPVEGRMCDPNNDLVSCVNNLCTCNETESEYNWGLRKCVGKVGASCKKYRGHCVEYAHCDVDRGTCKCEKGVWTGSVGNCIGALANSCNKDTPPCPGDLICLNSRCMCPTNSRQAFNQTDGKCISSVHGPCSKTVIAGKVYNFSCESHLECRNDHGIMECLCPKGFVSSNDRLSECKLSFGFGSPCSGDCDTQSSGLECINGKCDCHGLQEYDEDDHVCRGLVGFECDLHSSEDECVKGASCNGKRDKARMGLCRCRKGFQATANRTCTYKSGNTDINSNEPLTCQ